MLELIFINNIDLIPSTKPSLVCYIDTPPLNLDPLYCTDYIGQIICQAMYEPLFIRDIKSGLWKLGAAESVAISDDETTYVFQLSSVRKWSNGKSVTAYDFVSTFRRLLSSETKSPFASWFFCILNGEQYNEGTCLEDSLGVRALDVFKLEIKLEQPISYIKALLGTIQAAPSQSQNQKLNCSITNGPYYLETVKEDQVLLRRNSYHHKNTPSTIDFIDFKINKRLEEAVNDYINGKVDITCNTYFPFNKIEEFSHYEGFNMKDSAILYTLEHDEELWENTDVFRNLCSLIDREKIAKLLNNGVKPYKNLAPSSLFNQNPFETINIPMDMPSNIKSFEESPIRILYADYYPNGDIVEFIKTTWESLGLCVETVGLPFNEYLEAKQKREYHIYLTLFSPVLGHPMAYYLHYLSYLDDEIAFQLEHELNNYFSSVITNQDIQSFLQIEKFIKNQIPIVPLFTGKSIYLKKPNVGGYNVHVDGSICYQDLHWLSNNEKKDDFK
ncbi:hypothetical protein CN540_28335 [Bacillus toyonensis]|nr:hypothetical protein CON90_28690 [Bacillus toyonensis]PEK43065.1 hypothetical protein CN588_24725 [Bacillus toyonensis]PEL51686.1 hypothetical protein CN633_31210 [Bacillus toyonensis]PEN47010.1 hypothetical protein CN540_28335 [Bacillus toyonensis]PFZ33044.1 hypothetical protein COL64_24775 [Bacillus toyonensis]